MPRLHHVDHDFGPRALEVIRQANAFIADYAAQGYDLTLRQLYYQFVSRDLIPNRQSEYKRLGDIINDARLAGLVDWEAIVDRDPQHPLPAALERSGRDRPRRGGQLRGGQVGRPAAARGGLDREGRAGGRVRAGLPGARRPALLRRGYTSQSEVWGAAQRLEAYLQAGQEVVILHFGDHDPSGLDMTRDIEQRLRLFLLHDWVRFEGDNHAHMPRQERKAWLIREHPSQGWDTRLEVRRLALTWDQVQQYSPPPNPAKTRAPTLGTGSTRPSTATRAGSSTRSNPPCSASWSATRSARSSTTAAGTRRVERENAGAARLEAVSKRWPEIEDLVG